ncbi:MAG: 2-oxoacid:acceptor oxidoreductase family protein, partial [Bacillales bacterium]
MSILPKKNELGFYEIRLESIGGLGANLAGKMLAEAGVLGLGLNGSNFSSYGSEKKGTPVKSFVRFSDPDVEIRDHSPIEQPHVIGVFHEALYKTVNVV